MSLENRLDRFEKVLEDGLVKVCSSAGLASGILVSPDLEQKWDECVKDYVADAVENYNEYPEAAIGFAAFLGMAVAHGWDDNWDICKLLSYRDYYGPRGFDDMDDHILSDVLHLDDADAERISLTLRNCAVAAEELIRHEGIEAQTADGFYVLVRCFCVMYRIGCSIELTRLGYRKVSLSRP